VKRTKECGTAVSAVFGLVCNPEVIPDVGTNLYEHVLDLHGQLNTVVKWTKRLLPHCPQRIKIKVL
jgi:hypothetical protein